MTRRWVLARLPAALIAMWLAFANVATAQDLVTEVLPAGFRSATELVEIIRPLIPPPGSIGGFHNQLIIKTTPANLAEIRQVLRSLDKAPANLLISVRRSLDADISNDLARAKLALNSNKLGAQLGTSADGGSGASLAARNGGLNARAQIQRRTITSRDNSTQGVRVLEGKEAFIQSGESIPVAEQQVIISGAGLVVNEGRRYEEFGIGFWVRARLNGDQVTLDIYPDQRQLRADGSASVQRTSTSVSGVLGRWMEIGSVNTQSNNNDSAIGSSESISTRQQQSTYVKVERLD